MSNYPPPEDSPNGYTPTSRPRMQQSPANGYVAQRRGDQQSQVGQSGVEMFPPYIDVVESLIPDNELHAAKGRSVPSHLLEDDDELDFEEMESYRARMARMANRANMRRQNQYGVNGERSRPSLTPGNGVSANGNNSFHQTPILGMASQPQGNNLSAQPQYGGNVGFNSAQPVYTTSSFLPINAASGPPLSYISPRHVAAPAPMAATGTASSSMGSSPPALQPAQPSQPPAQTGAQRMKRKSKYTDEPPTSQYGPPWKHVEITSDMTPEEHAAAVAYNNEVSKAKKVFDRHKNNVAAKRSRERKQSLIDSLSAQNQALDVRLRQSDLANSQLRVELEHFRQLETENARLREQHQMLVERLRELEARVNGHATTTLTPGQLDMGPLNGNAMLALPTALSSSGGGGGVQQQGIGMGNLNGNVQGNVNGNVHAGANAANGNPNGHAAAMASSISNNESPAMAVRHPQQHQQHQVSLGGFSHSLPGPDVHGGAPQQQGAHDNSNVDGSNGMNAGMVPFNPAFNNDDQGRYDDPAENILFWGPPGDYQ